MRVLVALLVVSLLGAPLLAAGLTAGVVDSSLVTPHEWATGEAAAWHSAAYEAELARAGFTPRRLAADALTPAGLAGLRVLVIPGDHVYPERGKWGGPVLSALADWVKQGGIYVAPIGVAHWVARDLATGSRDSGHWGPDPLGLEFETAAGALPVTLTAQGRQLGLPDPAGLAVAPARTLREWQPAAVLAWDANYLPAALARPVGRGWVLHCGCGEKMEPAFARWWARTAAVAARAAAEGKLHAVTEQELYRAEGMAGLTLDDLDRRAFAPGRSPLQARPTVVKLAAGPVVHPAEPPSLSLDGAWEMIERAPGKGRERELLAAARWAGAIPAPVPGSIHTALLLAGKLPDPTVGLASDAAHQASHREYWLRRTFDRPAGLRAARLCFSGVDYSCTVWLNGWRLGRHEGPFGGPDFEVGPLLQDHNTLVVRLDPAPEDWQLVLKTNVVYGWHYVNLPSLGIWQPVRLVGEPAVKLAAPFVASPDPRHGVVDLAVTVSGTGPWSGELRGNVAPDNFHGRTWSFRCPVSGRGSQPVRLRFALPDPHLWWPVDLGAPDLYRLRLSFADRHGAGAALPPVTFGLRQIETRPLPEGPRPSRYQWQFVINGRPVFLKGANWCILDALLRLDRPRYERFLRLARAQHVQLLRAWGGGLLETDTFYDLCDRLGVMVYQEFPLTWQRFDALSPSVVDETAVRTIERLRNHPSLLMWGGGNEHSGRGPVVEQLGRLCLELDGTRPFHRTDPYGGSQHNYNVYWGQQPLDYNLTWTAPFIGEFGLASPPNLGSVRRYLPAAEQAAWPPPEGGSFIRHTPTYNKQHLEIMTLYAGRYAKADTMPGLITGMQLAQAVGLRHTLERARSRYPQATGACYYKLTDVYPACAWSTVDWYGVPKIAYWFVQDAFQPLHAAALFEHTDQPARTALRAPIVLLDDAGALGGSWSVRARAYDGLFNLLAKAEFRGKGGIDRVRRLGELVVPAAQAVASPLFVVTEVRAGGRLQAGTFYFQNCAARPGCLFRLPHTSLAVRREKASLVVRNAGRYPAVGVHVQSGKDELLEVEDGYFWLDPGEQRRLAVSGAAGLQVAAWNAKAAPVR